jgi:membrane protease subunit (stomatin/prohibitin family)
VEGALEVADGHEVAFYVMDQGNFSLWRAGKPSAIIIVRPTVISSNFTFTPTTSSTYYFVFDNEDTARRVVIFSLNTVENVTLLNPIIEFADYELLLIGIILCWLGIRGGKKRDAVSAKPDRWKCKFCGKKNSKDLIFCEKCGRSQR